MKDVLEKFNVRGKDGTVHRVTVLQSRINVSDFDGHETLPGLKEFQLVDGQHLTMIDESTFEIAATGERVDRIK